MLTTIEKEELKKAVERYCLLVGEHDMQDGIVGEPWETTVNHFKAGALWMAKQRRSEREFELAYCFGILGAQGVTVDKIAEATKSERWAKVKEEIKKILTQTDHEQEK